MKRDNDKRESSRTRRGRGEGSIYRRADGLWCATISAGYDQQGKRRRKAVYGDTKKAVQEKLREEHQRGFTSTNRLTVAQFLEHWLESSVKPSLAATTYARYKIVIDSHVKPYVGWMRVARLEPIHVAGMYAAQAAAGTSARNQELSGIVLGKALKSAVKLKILMGNPARDVDKPRPDKREMQVWNKQQVDMFLKAAAADRLYALYVLAITTGMRQGELFGLAWTDIDFGKAALSVNRTVEELGGKIRTKEPKTAKSRRRIDLPQFAVNALHEHRKAMMAEGHAGSPVFCDSRGGYLRRHNLSRRSFYPLTTRANEAAHEAAEKLGAEPVSLPQIRFHDLRHTAATLLLLAGENPKVVSERLGHASVTITLDTYSHVLPTMQKAAAEKLDKLFG